MAKKVELCFGERYSKLRDFICAEEYYDPVDLSKYSEDERNCLRGAAILDVSKNGGFLSELSWEKAYAIFLQLGINIPGDWYSGPRNMSTWFETRWSGKHKGLVKAFGQLGSDKNLHFTILQELLDLKIVREDENDYSSDY